MKKYALGVALFALVGVPLMAVEQAPIEGPTAPSYHVRPGQVVPATQTTATTTLTPNGEIPLVRPPRPAVESLPEEPERESVGRFPGIQPDLNADVQSLVEASISGEHPERLSHIFAPQPFNPEAWAENAQYRTTYIHTIEPARVRYTRRAGENVPELTIVGVTPTRVTQGEHLELKTHGVPLAPVTFTSLDGAFFPNSLSSITVVADEEGMATVDAGTGSGAMNRVHIMAGSPMSSRTVSWTVTVVLPLKTVSMKGSP